MRFDKYMDIRNEYVRSDLTIVELAEKYGMVLSTVYGISRTQGWAMLKDNRLGEIMSERNSMLTSIKVEGINFYYDVMEKCKDLLENEDFESPKDLKLIQETYSLAIEKFLLLSKEKLIVEEAKESASTEGLLDMLNKEV